MTHPLSKVTRNYLLLLALFCALLCSARLANATAEVGAQAATAGPSKKVAAAMGRGHWVTYDVTHGLAGADVRAMHQDRAGDLWLATFGGGVSRFDGEAFHNLTTADGLADDAVYCVLETVAGDLWFGTGGGISRFDGEAFENFTTADGLADDVIYCALEAANGELWFGTTDVGISRFDGEAFENFTTADGLADNTVYYALEAANGELWFGTGGGISRFDGETFENFTTADGLAHDIVYCVFEAGPGDLWFGTAGGGASHFDGENFTNFSVEHGLPHSVVESISQDDQGRLWFGTGGGGVSRFDGERFVNFSTQDGLAYNWVVSSVQDDLGRLWFGTAGGGVSRFDGSIFTTFTERDGLSSGEAYSFLEDSRGHLWIATSGGLTQYDGEAFTQYGSDDGLIDDWVRSMLEDDRGDLWIGFFNNGGLMRYDGEAFTRVAVHPKISSGKIRTLFQHSNGAIWISIYGDGVMRYAGGKMQVFSEEHGLASNWVNTFVEDQQGHIWLCSYEGGLSEYNGESFTHYTTQDGLIGNTVYTGLMDRQGDLWFGTYSGVSRYDGEKFHNFTTSDGLSGNAITTIMEDSQGHMWFATEGGGVSRYDGKVFQQISLEDGLAHNSVWAMLEDRRGNFWFATNAGITRYSQPVRKPPVVFLNAVVADRRYEDVREEVSVPSSVAVVAFEFGSAGYGGRPESMVYRYRLVGYDDEWQTTRARRVEYEDLDNGYYLFEIHAIDRDLVYSVQAAHVQLVIHPPYVQVVLAVGLLLALGGVGIATYAALQRRRERDQAREALMREMEDELEKAHELQMGLMPTRSPQIAGLDIAGHCRPANHVSGDFFQYFERQDTLSLCLADVTGHAMEAAIPMVMFSGILERQMEEQVDLETLFSRLNSSLFRQRVYQRTFVCCIMGNIDLATRRFHLINGGFPYPLHYRAAGGDLCELELDAYPLGASLDTVYPTTSIQLDIGDYLVFCSDGIMETASAAREFYGYDRTAALVQDCCSRGLDPDALIAELFATVERFAGGKVQEDDMTCMVLRVQSV